MNSNYEHGQIQESESVSLRSNFEMVKETLNPTSLFDFDNFNIISEQDGLFAVEIPTVRQIMMDDLIQLFTETVAVNNLYLAYYPDKGRKKWVAYSKPYPDEMFVVTIESWNHGIVESFFVEFFDSVEHLYGYLSERLTELSDDESCVIEKTSQQRMAANIIG